MFNDNRVDQDLRQHEEAHEAAELKFINNYQDNLDSIIGQARYLVSSPAILAKLEYVEMEPDALIWICSAASTYELKLSTLPVTLLNGLFEGICRSSGHDFEDYEADLMKSV